MKLDRLLGRGHITVSDTGHLQLNHAVFYAVPHTPKPVRGERCWCQACNLSRQAEQDALRAQRPTAPVPQPWEPRPIGQRDRPAA